MPDWLPGLLVALVAIIPNVWLNIQQRRKTNAEANKISAEADKVDVEVQASLIHAYKLLLDDVRQERDEARQGCQLRDEKVRGLEAEVEILYEQKMALIGHNQVLTARLAAKMNRDLINSEDD